MTVRCGVPSCRGLHDTKNRLGVCPGCVGSTRPHDHEGARTGGAEDDRRETESDRDAMFEMTHEE